MASRHRTATRSDPGAVCQHGSSRGRCQDLDRADRSDRAGLENRRDRAHRGHRHGRDAATACVSKKNLQTKVERVDEKLWAAIQALTPEALRETLGPLVGEDAVNAMLERRTRIQAEVDKLLAKQSRALVIIAEDQ